MNACPAVYVCAAQSPSGRYVSAPEMMFTTTGPAWLCQGNCAPGCTVYLTTTVLEGSSTWTTRVPPWCLIFTLRSIGSTNTERAVSGSAAIGGGGSTAAESST